ncbi:hypothetical protein GOEFS_095_00170 [Gordonia effusa NBRC 100432]|uniref:Knr4/Smi1-like domain-containing protein n=1 Tax=Gordonia effusa NBRC 100432 TaxID=1077974 RepID=H0R3Y1_9ACTN|nr:hypothetical protein [Gordonia effusa]GAB19782.1 hypothetical protein GOEFS_095_00170 [Gordonia effusa NBRC 100432]
MLLRSLHRRSASPAVDALKTLVPPPGVGTSINWTDVHKRFGLRLPDDYELIVENYGAGSFDDTLTIWVPDGHGGDDLFAFATAAADRLEDARDAASTRVLVEPDESAQSVDLGNGPLLFTPWGTASGGYFGYWHRCHRDPNKWPILFTDLAGVWLYHRQGLAQFLIDLLDGKFPCPTTESELPSTHVFATAAEKRD